MRAAKVTLQLSILVLTGHTHLHTQAHAVVVLARETESIIIRGLKYED